MEISISEAAKMLKVSRTTLYEKMKNGELVRCSSGRLETSELFRVFGHHPERRTRNEQKTLVQSVHVQQDTDSTTEQLYQMQIKNLEEALRQSQERERMAQEREEWQRGQIEKLTDTLKLLEAPKKEMGSWWRLWR